MICEANVRKYCKEDISLIENYEKAMNDKTQTWDCHHRDEVKILPSGIKVICTKEELIENDRYYNCPANELIFLTKSEHSLLHKIGRAHKGKKYSSEHKRKISAAHKGRKHNGESKRKMSENRIRTEFGRKFKEHFGIYPKENKQLYDHHRRWYKRNNNRCQWEIEKN